MAGQSVNDFLISIYSNARMLSSQLLYTAYHYRISSRAL